MRLFRDKQNLIVIRSQASTMNDNALLRKYFLKLISILYIFFLINYLINQQENSRFTCYRYLQLIRFYDKYNQ